MSMTDPIADMLTRVRNANSAGKQTVSMPSSKKLVEIARIMDQEGYIAGYEVTDGQPRATLEITLKYGDKKAKTIRGIKRISKPGLRIYAGKDELPRVLGGLGTAIISTSSGVMTDRDARKKGIGGEVIAYIWQEGEGFNMSRIGMMPITVPAGVEMTVDGTTVTVKGPKGELTRDFSELMTIKQDGDTITVERPDDTRESKSLHGLTRSLLNNMVVGVSTGFSKKLVMVGVGYRAALKGKDLEMQLGYSHPVNVECPEGITFEVPTPTEIVISGCSKEQVGQVAADVRKWRKPEPYKGKGIRYENEVIRRKLGKAAKGD